MIEGKLCLVSTTFRNKNKVFCLLFFQKKKLEMEEEEGEVSTHFASWDEERHRIEMSIERINQLLGHVLPSPVIKSTWLKNPEGQWFVNKVFKLDLENGKKNGFENFSSLVE